MKRCVLLLLLLIGCSPQAKLPPQATPASADAATARLVAGLSARLDSLRDELAAAEARPGASPTPAPTAMPSPVPTPSALPLPGFCGETAGPDADGDSLPDNCEQALAERHAPIFYHSSAEQYYPLPVERYLAASALWFRDTACSPEQQEQLKAAPTLADLLNAQIPAGCGSAQPARAASTRSRARERTFYLSDPPEDLRAGSRLPADWVTYFHAYPNTLNGVTLQYWRFYAWHNGAGKHGGDWVGVHLQLDSGGQPQRLVLIAEDALKTVAWHEVDQESPQRARLYIEPESHALQLTPAGLSAEGCKGLSGFFSCRLNPDKPETFVRHESWSTGQVSSFSGEQGRHGGLLNFGERSRPLNGLSFIQYSGLWGAPGRNAAHSGDWGPAYHGAGMLSNGFLSAWAQGMLNPRREEAYPLAVSP
jgi:hypothetical protein